MALTVSYPDVNGVRYDWSCIEVAIAGTQPTIGMKEISYKHSLEPGDVYGTHAQRIGRTRGIYKAEGSITLYKIEYAILIESLGDGYLEKSFDVTVSYQDTQGNIITDKLIGCRIKSPDNSHSQSGDPMIVKIDLDVMALIEDGKKPLTNMLGVST